MSCCSSRRHLPSQNGLRPVSNTHLADLPQAGESLRYLGKDSIALRGPFSGRVYQVGTSRRLIEVDRSDVPTFLRSGLFSTS